MSVPAPLLMCSHSISQFSHSVQKIVQQVGTQARLDMRHATEVPIHLFTPHRKRVANPCYMTQREKGVRHRYGNRGLANTFPSETKQYERKTHTEETQTTNAKQSILPTFSSWWQHWGQALVCVWTRSGSAPCPGAA